MDDMMVAVNDERREAEQALREVCGEYACTLEELLGPSRYPDLVAARRYAARRLKDHGWPVTSIALVLHRDRSTIYNLLYIP